jgi:hypothetical protein
MYIQLVAFVPPEGESVVAYLAARVVGGKLGEEVRASGRLGRSW